jgi:hypothetical protein
MRERFDWLRDPDHRRRHLRAVEAAVNRGQLGPADRPALEAALAALEADGGLTARERHRVLRVRIALAVDDDERGAIFSAHYLPRRVSRSSSPSARHTASSVAVVNPRSPITNRETTEGARPASSAT